MVEVLCLPQMWYLGLERMHWLRELWLRMEETMSEWWMKVLKLKRLNAICCTTI